MFDLSISLGNLLTIGGFLVFVTMYIVNSKNVGKLLGVRLEMIDASMIDFKKEIEKLTDVIVKQAQQDIRLNQQDERALKEGQRVDELDRRLARLIERVSESGMLKPKGN